MANKKREDVREQDITGLKYFDKLLPLFERLHKVGCERDKAGNRQLHFDQYATLVLLFLFNPIVTSLRALQQASELKKVQSKLGCSRASLGSLSESTAVFDPELLREIIGELAEQLKPVQKVGHGHLDHVLTAVDGSVVKTLSTIAQAAYLKNCHGDSKSAWRLHTHFDIDRGVPVRIDVTSGLNSGKSDEKNVLRKPDHPIRLILVKTNPHTQRGKQPGGKTGPASDGILRIATNLLDVPAEIIGDIYRQRWTVEIFFRFFKHILGCRHLLSQDPVGIEIQTYMAIIACMLISLWTGRKPTLRTYEMVCYYFIGMADEDELLAHIAKLKPQAA